MLHVAGLAGAVFLGIAQMAQAAPLDVDIVTSTAWRATYTDPTGLAWTQPGYVEGGSWQNAGVITLPASAGEPNTPSEVLTQPTSAQFIWGGSPAAPDGTGGPDEVWLRYSFDLKITPSSEPFIASIIMAVDDDFQLFVNGNSILLNQDQGFATCLQPNNTNPCNIAVDFTSSVRDGENVIAIHAVDGGWGNPSDRSYQWVLVDGKIQTVPEPASFALLGMGLLGLWGVRRLKGQEGS